jgi:hypothetical protein
MLQKVVKFWRALSPASMPRALWIVIHHIKLPAIQEDLWLPLLDVLRELLIYQPLATTEMHIQASFSALFRIFCLCWRVPYPSSKHVCSTHKCPQW